MRRLVAALAVLVFCPSAAAAENTAWLSYGHDNQLTNAIASSTLTAATARTLHMKWITQLDGPVYASPLAARVGGRELLFVATENGSVYALDGTDGLVVWHRDVGTTATPTCGTWGVTSTGAIEAPHGVLYVASADGNLYGLELQTGDDAPGFPRRVVSNTQYEYVWGGLRIARDRLYVPVASYCDEGPDGNGFPQGRLIAIHLTDPAQSTQWEAVPGPGHLGGIWGWGGVSIDPSSGNVFTGVGNSHVWSDACSCYVDDAGYGDQMVELSPGLDAVLQADSLGLPNTVDDDFGAAPVLFRPNGCPPLAAANNKSGTLYIWNRTSLAAGPIASIPLSDGVAAFVGTPSWSVGTQTLYDAQAVLFRGGTRLGNGVRALHVEPGCTFSRGWGAALGDGNQATPLVAGDVVFATGGTPGGFFALRSKNGARLWRFKTAGATVAAMISVEGRIVGADAAGLVYEFEPTVAAKAKARKSRSGWQRVG